MTAYRTTTLAGILLMCGFISTGFAQPMHDHNTASAAAMDATPATEILSVTRSGDPNGRTVVLIPGLASSSDVWTQTAAEFQEYDLRIVQVAGFAGAAVFETDGKYTDAIAEAINTHLVDFPGNDPVVVGHSLGGFVALKAALSDETPINELVIVDSLPFLAGLFMPGTTPEQASQIAPALATQMATMPPDAFDRQQKAGLGRLVKTQSYRAVLDDWSQTSDQTTVATAVGELLGADLRDDIANINADITVLVAHDPAMGISVTQVKEMYAKQYASAPHHQIVVIEQSFHFIMVDQAALFYEALKEALAD